VSEKLKLHVKERDLTLKPNRLRKEGLVPAIIYSKGNKNMPLSINAHDFELCYRQAGGNTILALEIEKVDGSNEKKNALIYQVSKDPVKDKVLHADFLQIKMNEKITATIPLKFIGDSVAVIEKDGSLMTQKSEVEVECFPADLPHEIEVDISPLVDFEAAIHVADLKVSEGVAVLDDPEETIVYVEEPRSEEEMAELEEPVTPEEEMPPSEHGEETAAPEEGEQAEDPKEE
jgi:large subunit ribosomal protein L25